MQPTSSEITLLRTRPHETQLWLSIYQPQTMLACQITGTMARGSMQIPYDTVSAGSYLLTTPGMTMYVGSSAGGNDIGRIRVRGATGTYIDVAENADIDWQADYYLTVKNYFEIWPVYPRIILQTGTTNTQWYKDWDIEYTDQNSVLGTFVNMGSHAAAFIDNGQAQIYYSASGSYNLKDEAMSYDWWFQGATTTGSSNQTPGLITYTSPGHYTTRLIITTSGTASDTSYRHVSIYERPASGTSTPPLKWNLISLDGSRGQGGYIARIVVREDTANIVDGALVVIFADDRYGTTEQSIGGNALGRQKIVFAGYIVDGSISYDHQDKSVEFEVGSPTELMKLAEGFGVSIQSSDDPDNAPATNDDIPSGWVALLNMNCKRAIYHYLRWHSTVLMTNDFEFRGTDQLIQYFDADRESLYSAISTLMNLALVGDVVSDRQGKIWAEVSASSISSGTSAFPYNMTLDKQDWMGVATIDERHVNDISFLEMGGVNYQGPGFESTALMSSAPGSTPAYRGKVERIQGLALSSQDQLNELVGNVYAWKNAKYPSVQLNIVGNYRNFDVAPQEIVRLNLDGNDNNRGLVWNSKAFINQSMSWSYDAEFGLFLPTVDLAEVTQGFDAATIVIPPTPPTSGEDGGGFYIPPFEFPPFPPFPVPVAVAGGGNPTWIPAYIGRNITDGLDVTPEVGTSGVQTSIVLEEGKLCTVPFNFVCNYNGTVNIYALIQATASSGDVVKIRNEGYTLGFFGSTICATPVGWSTAHAYQNYTMTCKNDYELVMPISQATVGRTFVAGYFSRDGTDGADTFTGDLALFGWIIIYT